MGVKELAKKMKELDLKAIDCKDCRRKLKELLEG